MKAIKGIVISINESDITVLGDDGVFYSLPLLKQVPLLGEELHIPETLIQIPSAKKEKQRFSIKRVRTWGLVASLFILLLTTVIFFPYEANAAYVVALEINPSMELYVNDEHKVIKVVAMNEEATDLLESMSVKGKDLAIAIKEITDAAKAHGFIHSGESNLLTPVIATVVGWSDTLAEVDLQAEVQKQLQTTNQSEDILVLSTSREILEQAHEQKLPVFKYQVVQTIESKGIELEQDAISSRSVSELVQQYDVDPKKLVTTVGRTKETNKEKNKQTKEEKKEEKRDKKDKKDKEKQQKKEEQEQKKERKKEEKDIKKENKASEIEAMGKDHSGKGNEIEKQNVIDKNKPKENGKKHHKDSIKNTNTKDNKANKGSSEKEANKGSKENNANYDRKDNKASVDFKKSNTPSTSVVHGKEVCSDLVTGRTSFCSESFQV